jgi:hypothetical protein
MADYADRIRDCEELEEFTFSRFPALREREKEVQRIRGGLLWADKQLLEGALNEADAAEAREKLRRAIRELENMDETTEAGRAWRRLTEARRAVCGGHASGAVISGAGPGYGNLVALFAPGPAGSPPPPTKPDAARNGTAEDSPGRPEKCAFITPCPPNATEIIGRIPSLAPASEIARLLGYPNKAKTLSNLLGKYRLVNKRCARKVEERRQNEAEWLYDANEIVGKLVEWTFRLYPGPRND